MTTITTDTGDTRARLAAIATELNQTHKERSDIITGMMTAAVARQHLLMIGPGGTGKSLLVRDFVSRIDGANLFEKALDETSTPDEVSGPPDIKCMVEEGKTRRVTTGMMPESTHVFLDEFFNANGPTLHHLMPMLNERLFHNNGTPIHIPLRSCYMGTNRLNAEHDMAALWDRVHHRHPIAYVAERENLADLVAEAIVRRAGHEPEKTTITLADLDAAYEESLTIPVPEATYSVFLDLIRDLQHEGVVVGTRRIVEGMAAVLATAWLNGHDEVRVGDLSVLRHMFWTLSEQIPTVKKVILEATNPGEKKALELLEELDGLKAEYDKNSGLDDVKRQASSIAIFRKLDRVLGAALPLKTQAAALGADNRRVDDLVDRCDTFKAKIATEVFGLSGDDVTKLKNR